MCFSDKLISDTRRLEMQRPHCVARYKTCRGISRDSRCCGHRHRRTCRKNEMQRQTFGQRPRYSGESTFPTRRRHIAAASNSLCAIATCFFRIGCRFEHASGYVRRPVFYHGRTHFFCVRGGHEGPTHFFDNAKKNYVGDKKGTTHSLDSIDSMAWMGRGEEGNRQS